MIRTVLFAAISAALFTASAQAQVERQHDPHVHGVATGNLSLEGEDLRLELEIPGVNLIGFEHPPRIAEQREIMDATLEFLRDGRWVRADRRGGCEVSSLEAHTHGYSDDHDDSSDSHAHSHDHDHDHDHGHDHSHDHDHEGHNGHDHDHAEFHVIVKMSCATPENLGWIDLRLFNDFPGNRRMDIDVLTETLATQARLRPGQARIDLR